MKAILTLFILLFWQAFAIAQDLPNPAANIQTMPQDSYIIAMDNTWQATTGTNPSYHYFNLKAYGLIVYLLDNNIKVKRVIRAGKTKDDIDFSVSCRQIKPSSELNPVLRDFKAGPFVIFGSDLLQVNIDQLIDNFNNNSGGVSGINNDTAKVRVYKTTTDVDVDVRYDYNLINFKPKVAILTDGGNAPIHTTYMTLAGVPASNYSLGANTDLAVSCFTFASEPHNDYPVTSVVNNIKSFVAAGGNFLAQCVTVPIYEGVGLFQSSGGITVANTTPSAVYYPNADLGMAQFEGNFSIKQGGSCQNWKYNTSSFTNSAHAFATNTNGVVSNTSLIGASASKMIPSYLPGGMVYYLGNHSYSRTDDYNHINGMRMYMNALLTPSDCQNILRYTVAADCNAGAMKVSAASGPAVAYPVTFYLYEDVGTTSGTIDPGDAFVGAASVSTPGAQSLIPMLDVKTDYVVKVQPSASCYRTEEVQPSSCRFAALSASLKNFTANHSGQQVLLRWQTLAEQGNEGFYVQRFINNEWKDMGFVPSSAKDGNSNSRLQYQFITETSFAGTAQYRIKMQSFDKAVHYSEIKTVQAEEVSSFSIYPNPSATGKIVLFFPNATVRSIVLYDISGRVVRSFEEVTDMSFEIAKLNSGIYLVKVTDATGKAQTQKLVIN